MVEVLFWLNSITGLGPKRILELAPTCDTLKGLWNASLQQLVEEYKINPKLARSMINMRQKDLIKNKVSDHYKNGIELISYVDKKYPKVLKEIHDPPPILYAKGNLDLLDFAGSLSIGVVGTRKPTPYGVKMTKNIVKDLSYSDVMIVSGMAKGVDALAHKTTLDNDGRTIAVLGCGCNVVYPKINAYIYEEILSKGGLILSEFPMGTQPLRHHFPRRNRIISGLSVGIVVIEAGEKSGSLITARYAVDQGRSVMTVPGNVTNPMSRGSFRIIRDGGLPVGSAKDVLDELDIQMKSVNVSPNLVKTSLEKSLAMIEPATADQISALLGDDVYDIMMQLTLLEVKGRIKRMPGGLFVCA